MKSNLTPQTVFSSSNTFCETENRSLKMSEDFHNTDTHCGTQMFSPGHAVESSSPLIWHCQGLIGVRVSTSDIVAFCLNTSQAVISGHSIRTGRTVREDNAN